VQPPPRLLAGRQIAVRQGSPRGKSVKFDLIAGGRPKRQAISRHSVGVWNQPGRARRSGRRESQPFDILPIRTI